MLLEVKGELSCYCDCLRVREAGAHRHDLVVISLFGPRNAVRAAWAKLSSSSRRGYHESIEVGGQHVAKAGDAAYTTVGAPLGRGLLHCVVYHQQLGHNAPERGYIYQVGPDAKRRYFDRLARWCPVPLRATWRSKLWDLGRERNAIIEVPGHGLDVWWVSTERDQWEPIVRDALIAGELT